MIRATCIGVVAATVISQSAVSAQRTGQEMSVEEVQSALRAPKNVSEGMWAAMAMNIAVVDQKGTWGGFTPGAVRWNLDKSVFTVTLFIRNSALKGGVNERQGRLQDMAKQFTANVSRVAMGELSRAALDAIWEVEFINLDDGDDQPLIVALYKKGVVTLTAR